MCSFESGWVFIHYTLHRHKLRFCHVSRSEKSFARLIFIFQIYQDLSRFIKVSPLVETETEMTKKLKDGSEQYNN
jgi:hypothetical protein